MSERRAQRVAEAIRDELTEILALELADPRAAGASVTEVVVSSDLRHATARVSCQGEIESTVHALEHAASFLRRQLAERLNLFRVPELHFEADHAVRRDRMESLLRRIRRGRSRQAPPFPGSTP